MPALPLPDDTDRLTILGATGSGKTQAAMWHLSKQNFEDEPWIIYDFKMDPLINDLEDVTHLGVTDPIPDSPGIYIVHPHPADDENVEAQMWKIWEKGNTGVYVDEGYMLGQDNRAFRALLTQGRSKHIPMIVLSQRPTWMDRFVFSETSFIQLFRLQDQRDLKKVKEFIPYSKVMERLPEYESWYYDVSDNRLYQLNPVPDRDAILDTLQMRLSRIRKEV